jgi:hypothetical protein
LFSEYHSAYRRALCSERSSHNLLMTTERMSLAEMEKRFDGEWIVISEPELDAGSQVISGRVFFHSPSRDDAEDAMLKAPSGELPITCFKQLPPGMLLVPSALSAKT